MMNKDQKNIRIMNQDKNAMGFKVNWFSINENDLKRGGTAPIFINIKQTTPTTTPLKNKIEPNFQTEFHEVTTNNLKNNTHIKLIEKASPLLIQNNEDMIINNEGIANTVELKNEGKKIILTKYKSKNVSTTTTTTTTTPTMAADFDYIHDNIPRSVTNSGKGMLSSKSSYLMTNVGDYVNKPFEIQMNNQRVSLTKANSQANLKGFSAISKIPSNPNFFTEYSKPDILTLKDDQHGLLYKSMNSIKLERQSLLSLTNINNSNSLSAKKRKSKMPKHDKIHVIFTANNKSNTTNHHDNSNTNSASIHNSNLNSINTHNSNLNSASTNNSNSNPNHHSHNSNPNINPNPNLIPISSSNPNKSNSNSTSNSPFIPNNANEKIIEGRKGSMNEGLLHTNNDNKSLNLIKNSLMESNMILPRTVSLSHIPTTMMIERNVIMSSRQGRKTPVEMNFEFLNEFQNQRPPCRKKGFTFGLDDRYMIITKQIDCKDDKQKIQLIPSLIQQQLERPPSRHKTLNQALGLDLPNEHVLIKNMYVKGSNKKDKDKERQEKDKVKEENDKEKQENDNEKKQEKEKQKQEKAEKEKDSNDAFLVNNNNSNDDDYGNSGDNNDNNGDDYGDNDDNSNEVLDIDSMDSSSDDMEDRQDNTLLNISKCLNKPELQIEKEIPIDEDKILKIINSMNDLSEIRKEIKSAHGKRIRPGQMGVNELAKDMTNAMATIKANNANVDDNTSNTTTAATVINQNNNNNNNNRDNQGMPLFEDHQKTIHLENSYFSKGDFMNSPIIKKRRKEKIKPLEMVTDGFINLRKSSTKNDLEMCEYSEFNGGNNNPNIYSNSPENSSSSESDKPINEITLTATTNTTTKNRPLTAKMSNRPNNPINPIHNTNILNNNFLGNSKEKVDIVIIHNKSSISKTNNNIILPFETSLGKDFVSLFAN